MSGSRKGSALLIVLGMLSFMVVSAVAFSAYMRTSRLPSSYLRRVVASRMLAKAAMAEAIDEIDAAVGNFPHPGVWIEQGENGTGLSRSANLKDENGRPLSRAGQSTAGRLSYNSNAWIGRVYIGGTDQEDTVQARVAQIPQSDTVSTLSLEALAYIPPPLVNEARYYSRHSNAGKWHSMPFEAGRYAFCALDVSDYFDINALTADVPRSSASNSRISFSYLFEDDGHQQPDNGKGATWDAFVSQALSTGVPFVSLADWNLALGGNGAIGDIKSYFYDYLTASKSTASFYGGDGGSDTSAEKIRRMTFVTDGWFPTDEELSTSAAKTEAFDLADSKNQPFAESELKKASPNYYDVVESPSEGSAKLRKHLHNLTRVMLYDYLDEDRVPVSLSIPSVERVPMICGLEPKLDGKVKLIKTVNPGESGNKDQYDPEEKPMALKRKVRRTVVFCLDSDSLFGGMPSVKALVTYPFRHKDGENETFKLDGGMALYFTTGTMGLRPRSAVKGLRFTADNKFNSASVEDGVILLPFKQKPSVTFSEVNKAKDAVKEFPLSADPAGVAGDLKTDKYAVLRVVYEWEQNDTTTPPELGAWRSFDNPEPTEKDIVDAVCNLRPLGANGAVDSAFTGSKSGLVSAMAGKEMQLNVAVYARILDKNNKTVDLVPACVESDDLNGSSNASMPESQVLLSDNFGNGTPLMRFDTARSGSAGFECSISGLTKASEGAEIELSPSAVMIGDPRYNYAPESWFNAGGTISADAWLSDNGAAGGAGEANRRDGDIFMTVSDQNYLQSVYELANLPRVAERGFFDAKGGASQESNLQSPNAFAGMTFADKGSDKIINRQFMWRTFDPFMRYENSGITFEDLQIVNSGHGFKITPYSDSTNVMMAAFANTPHDWRCASTNERTNANIVNMTASQFNRAHAWNAYSTGAKLEWDDLGYVAETFMSAMRQSGKADWEDVWADLPWYSDDHLGDAASQQLLGEPLTKKDDANRLYDTDKKFLYGFWHDCFAVRQQLYLIFVRAEPLLMGGGKAHQAPPQLGVRAVALVWRDPYNRTSDTTMVFPHRTRILFYRQFE